ncbi:MAG: ATP-dependent helicase HrpA, partial [Paracoccaceae bacterium]
MQNTTDELSALSDCWLGDRPGLLRMQRDLGKRARRGKSIDQLQARFDEALARSRQRVATRRDKLPAIHYPDLPVSREVPRLKEAFLTHQLIIVAGETGSGKTTQLPKLCLEAGRGVSGLIGHTQPRRLAARTVAQRIASELNSVVGEAVGFQVRFQDQVSEHSFIKLMTDGILLAEIQSDPMLSRYDTLIIDEAHERSLNIDFLLGYLKILLPKRPDLKVIITSATIDVERFSQHFSAAPVLEVTGRSYPVEVRYRPEEELSAEGDQPEAIEQALWELHESGGRRHGDVLIFLSGEREIRAAALKLRKSELKGLEVLPLYSRLSGAEQQRIFDDKSRRGWRIILSTNVAETSLTVPGIHYVIDTGTARISRYSYRSKVQRLPVEPISKASANQRAGRCGRVAPGVCIRLYSEVDFETRPDFTEPEIQRTNLASVILKMLNLGLGDIDEFPFIDLPDSGFINDGYKLLAELGAVQKRSLTSLGRTLVRLPVDPRMARILQEAQGLACLNEALIIVSALSIQDPRERPADKQQVADEKHRHFYHKESDFLGFVNLWNYVEEQRQELSNSQFRKLCQREFLSFTRVQEWRELHWQLKLVCKQNQWSLNKKAADYEPVHRAILAGFLSQVAQKDEDNWYRGTRNRKLRVFPGSALFKKSPAWLVAAEMVETTQLYARCVARVEPEWLLGINDDILKYQFYEPHWQQRVGRVEAFQETRLYGLVIQDRKRVHYGPLDPVACREILIRSALVEGRYRGSAVFFHHNQKMIAEVLELESKVRRRDLLVSDDVLYDFYDKKIPEGIVSSRHLESWLKQASGSDVERLNLNRANVLAASTGSDTGAQFPDCLEWEDLRLPLSYRFEPGHASDGVTLEVPLPLLNRVPDYLPEWLVPGLLAEKCVALVKALPKQWRKKFMPIPTVVAEALVLLAPVNKSLVGELAEALRRKSGIVLPVELWSAQSLDDYYRMNIRVLDEHGKLLGESRHLNQLKARFADAARASLQEEGSAQFPLQVMSSWALDELPVTQTIRRGDAEVQAYPALVDKGDVVELVLLDNAKLAEQESRRAVLRLIILQQQATLKPHRERLLKSNAVQLQLAALKQQRRDWLEALVMAAVDRVYLHQRALPRNAQAYEAMLTAGHPDLFDCLKHYESLAENILVRAAAVQRSLKKLTQLHWFDTVSDVRQQLDALLFKDFIQTLEQERLLHYPRYLQAIELRLNKLEG